MNKNKKWIMSGAALFGAGILICISAFAFLGFDFKKLSTVKLVSDTYDVDDSFENIQIKADTEDICFLPSDDGKCRVICYEEENNLHDVHTENNTLTISSKNTQKLNINFGISTQSPSITVYLPEKSYKMLDIDSDTGDTKIPKDFSFENINIRLDTGDVSCSAPAKEKINIITDTGDMDLSSLSASDMTLSSDTGDIVMTDVIALNQFNIENNTGDVKFNGCDAETIFVRTDTGDIKGTLLSEKIFITKTDTGDINVPQSVTGGKCELTTDTGDIRIELK